VSDFDQNLRFDLQNNDFRSPERLQDVYEELLGRLQRYQNNPQEVKSPGMPDFEAKLIAKRW
jgi:hypothetical protein